MPNYVDLVNAMKRAGCEAVSAGGPVTDGFGKVVQERPLKVLVDQKLMLGEAQLILTRNVTDYMMVISRAGSEGATEEVTIHNGLKQGEEVLLLRQQGGQKYVILDKVGGL